MSEDPDKVINIHRSQFLSGNSNGSDSNDSNSETTDSTNVSKIEIDATTLQSAVETIIDTEKDTIERWENGFINIFTVTYLLENAVAKQLLDPEQNGVDQVKIKEESEYVNVEIGHTNEGKKVEITVSHTGSNRQKHTVTVTINSAKK